MNIISYYLLLNCTASKSCKKKYSFIKINKGCFYFWNATYSYLWLQNLVTNHLILFILIVFHEILKNATIFGLEENDL